MWSYGERILLTLWVGGMWTTGYVVAPVLFNSLDRVTAGNVAGQLFTIVSYIGLVTLTLVLVSGFVQSGKTAIQQWHYRFLFVMLLLVLVGQFVLQPLMAEIKSGGIRAEEAKQFATLHGVASVIYLINSLLGLLVVARGTGRAKQQDRLSFR